MSYPPDIFGLLQEIRDTLNTNNDPTSQYDASEFGLLQNIRDLLNTGHASTAQYTADINGLLTNIRDLLNTGNASTASYSPDQYGLWQSIRDFANTGNASVASYPDSIFGLVQATRDFIISGGGGGSGYVAKAVHFDGNTSLGINSLSCSDNGIASWVVWFQPQALTPNVSTFWVSDPNNQYQAFSNVNLVNGVKLLLGDAGNSALLQILTGPLNLHNGSGTSFIPTADIWYPLICSCELNHNAGSKRGRIYLGDIDITWNVGDFGNANIMSMNGLQFLFGDDGFGSGFLGSFADFRFMDTTLLDGSGDIPVATRRLFIDAEGKPVDPATATAALGQPVILYSGDATSFGINQGTGGSSTITGSITNAATSPSD